MGNTNATDTDRQIVVDGHGSYIEAGIEGGQVVLYVEDGEAATTVRLTAEQTDALLRHLGHLAYEVHA